jgi:hypothetical protein
MMKKWLFSNNGNITGPFGLTESQELIKNNPSLYAWNPSFTHWVPVSHIDEFKEHTLVIPVPPTEVPLELISEFIDEERELISQLDVHDENLNATHTELGELDIDIHHYQQLTVNLNKEVKAVISNIEQQYAALEKSLANVRKTGFQ